MGITSLFASDTSSCHTMCFRISTVTEDRKMRDVTKQRKNRQFGLHSSHGNQEFGGTNQVIIFCIPPLF